MQPELNMSTSHHIYRRPFLSSWGVLALAFSDAARNVGRSTGADGHREDTQNREMLSAANPGWATKVLFTVNKQANVFICSYYLVFFCLIHSGGDFEEQRSPPELFISTGKG